MHVKETLMALVKQGLREKHVRASEVEILKILEETEKGFIDENMWRRIVEKMYDGHDCVILEGRFREIVSDRI